MSCMQCPDLGRLFFLLFFNYGFGLFNFNSFLLLSFPFVSSSFYYDFQNSPYLSATDYSNYYFSMFYAVFPVSDPPWIEIHTFCKCAAQGLKAQQSSFKCQLWLKNMWFWTSSCHLRNWFYDRICRYKMVPCARAVIELFRLHCSYWCMVSWLYFHGIDGSKALISWQRSCAPATFAHGGNPILLIYSVILLVSGRNRIIRIW